MDAWPCQKPPDLSQGYLKLIQVAEHYCLIKAMWKFSLKNVSLSHFTWSVSRFLPSLLPILKYPCTNLEITLVFVSAKRQLKRNAYEFRRDCYSWIEVGEKFKWFTIKFNFPFLSTTWIASSFKIHIIWKLQCNIPTLEISWAVEIKKAKCFT